MGAAEIDRWHKERGFLSPSGKHIGYHWVVRRNGTIERGRDESEVGAHVQGHNSRSIGIVWVGRDRPTDAQYLALVATAAETAKRYALKPENVHGHTELNHGKSCPNLNMAAFRINVSLAMAGRPYSVPGRIGSSADGKAKS